MSTSDVRRRAEARLELEKRRARTDLYRYLALQAPELSQSRHYARLVDALDRSCKVPVWALCAGPPQTGKSTLFKHHVVRRLKTQPGLRVAYVMYSGLVAGQVSRELRKMTSADGLYAGVEHNRGRYEADTVLFWTTGNGGSVTLGGPGGAYTGKGYDLVIIDDPYKNREDAESKALREKISALWRSTLQSRVSPNTASVFITHQRWRPDDLIGELEASDESWWEKLFFKAINDDGEALWPESPQWNLEALLRLKEGLTEYYWQSQYQQNPIARGSQVFWADPPTYRELPAQHKGAFGLDLAYSEDTAADWSICLEGWRAGPKIYLVDCLREQIEAPAFGEKLKFKAGQRPGWKMRWDWAGGEKGSAQLLKKLGVPIRAIPARGDKFVRAQEVAAAWNAGNVLVPDISVFPHAARWVKPFLKVVQKFTGQGAEQDDDVDALASLYKQLTSSSPMLEALMKHAGKAPESPLIKTA